MSLLVVTSDCFFEHDTGPGHVEAPSRLTAVAAGMSRAGIGDAVITEDAPPAPLESILQVHSDELVDQLRQMSAQGGGRVDADTVVSPRSWLAAQHAVGAGLQAIDRLEAGVVDTALCTVRPPGHHATSSQSMGFCLLNNVAVAASTLADRGERVLIVDYDAHHGNGTQDVFWDDPRVLFVSFHQWPCYPGTGRIDDRGGPNATGLTVNLPLPPGATGDVYLSAWDRAVAPVVDGFAPTWVLISAGFDAHRDDPITSMGLTSADLAALTRRVRDVAPAGRLLLFLEGGYNLEALTSTTAAVSALLLDTTVEDSDLVESATNDGPGAEVVDAAEALLDR